MKKTANTSRFSLSNRHLSKLQDRGYLQTSQYRTSDNLTARADLHSRFTVSAMPWPDWVLPQLELRPRGQVIECGAGPGWLWDHPGALPAASHLTLTDLSIGMVTEALARLGPRSGQVSGCAADIQSLPFPTASANVIVANHMLYHVPDLNRALGEVTRVLRPDGRFVAATNGHGHMAELRALSAELFPSVPGIFGMGLVSLPFALENGALLLAPHFAEIELRPYDSHLEVTDAQTLVNYILSSNEARAAVTDEEFDTAVATLQARIDADGPIHISKQTGVFVAKVPRKALDTAV